MAPKVYRNKQRVSRTLSTRRRRRRRRCISAGFDRGERESQLILVFLPRENDFDFPMIDRRETVATVNERVLPHYFSVSYQRVKELFSLDA